MSARLILSHIRMELGGERELEKAATGLEPATFDLQSRCSTTELDRRKAMNEMASMGLLQSALSYKSTRLQGNRLPERGINDAPLPLNVSTPFRGNGRGWTRTTNASRPLIYSQLQ